MIYVNRRDVFFAHHNKGKLDVFSCKGEGYNYDLVRGCNFNQRGEDIFCTDLSVNLDGWKKVESVIVKDWKCSSIWGWLAITTWGGRIGFVVGEDTSDVYKFYVIYDSAYTSEKGEVITVDKKLVERLPLSFALEVDNKIKSRDVIYS